MATAVHRIETGKLRQNCFIVSSEGKQALIIDPGENSLEIQEYISLHQLEVLAILNTHGHFDHIGAVADLKDVYGVAFYLSGGDAKLVKSANFYRTIFEGARNLRIPEIDFDLSKNEVLRLGPFEVQVLATPGHTPGGVCLKIEGRLFAGDNIIGRQIGRTDLPGGNRAQLLESVKKICALPQETELYPGHGQMVKIAELGELAKSVGREGQP